MCTEKSTIMTSSTNDIGTDISMNGRKLDYSSLAVTSLKYLGAITCKDGTCSAEIHSRIAPEMTAMTRLIRPWRSNTLSFTSKFKLHESLVISIFLYDRQT